MATKTRPVDLCQGFQSPGSVTEWWTYSVCSIIGFSSNRSWRIGTQVPEAVGMGIISVPQQKKLSMSSPYCDPPPYHDPPPYCDPPPYHDPLRYIFLSYKSCMYVMGTLPFCVPRSAIIQSDSIPSTLYTRMICKDTGKIQLFSPSSGKTLIKAWEMHALTTSHEDSYLHNLSVLYRLYLPS